MITLPLVPHIGFGHVGHTRQRPRRNVFRYGTWFVWLPMRTLPQLSEHSALPINPSGWASFFDCDHGDGRGPEQGGAVAWLDELLQRHDVTDATGDVWLHTYPRVLGFTFKPVSFWYCHRCDGTLRAIVAEVNNTFGERHCYLIDTPAWDTDMRADKVFHVSPFCDVQGHYTFRFVTAMHGLHSHAGSVSNAAPTPHTVARIDYDDGHGPLLHTSVNGALVPATARLLRQALWRYPAMTLMVVARIHWQALKLWTQRAGFRSKPMPPTQFVTRQTQE